MGMTFDGDVHPQPPPREPKEYEIVRYDEKAPGFHNHHGVLDVWQSHNIPGYQRRAPDSPTVRLTVTRHERTYAVYRAWLKSKTGKEVGGTVDWTKIDVREVLDLGEKMFDAADVPREAREEYYREATRYVYHLGQ
jgi:hypothetical protein